MTGNAPRYLLVLTAADSDCELNGEHECAVGAVEVASRAEARQLAARLRAAGLNPHLVVPRLVGDYLEPERA